MEPDSRDLGQCVAECASRGGDTKDKIIASGHESGQEEQSDSESEGAAAVPRTSPRGAKESRRRKNTNHISYSDLSYLSSLSRQEKRRIEGEKINGRKLALTIHNIVQELRGVDLFKIHEFLYKTILGIPHTQLAELRSAHHSTDEQEAAVVRYWLLRDPLVSWRRIIFQLDEWAGDSGYGHYSDIADSIRHYAEELTDNTLTHRNLSSILNHVVGVEDLMDCLNIPANIRDKIREHIKDEEQQRYECVHYYLKSSPFALWGWGFLGGELHHWGKEDALIAAKAYIQRAPELSLTLDTLSSVLDSTQHLGGLDDVSAWLQIPDSKGAELQWQYYNNRRQLPRALSTIFLTDNPSPSWSTVAFALWEAGEHRALEVVQKLYLKDINLQDLCLEKLSSWLKSTSDIDTLPLPTKLRVELKYRLVEPSLTLDTLSCVLGGVQRLVDFGGVCAWLQIPRSKQDELEQQCDRRQLPRAFSTVFLTENPYPSWSTVALALWENGELGALEIVQKLYLKDINLQNLYLEKLSSWLKGTSDIDTLPLPVKLKVKLKHRLFGE